MSTCNRSPPEVRGDQKQSQKENATGSLQTSVNAGFQLDRGGLIWKFQRFYNLDVDKRPRTEILSSNDVTSFC